MKCLSDCKISFQGLIIETLMPLRSFSSFGIRRIRRTKDIITPALVGVKEVRL
jgi:hypothetical protein